MRYVCVSMHSFVILIVERAYCATIIFHILCPLRIEGNTSRSRFLLHVTMWYTRCRNSTNRICAYVPLPPAETVLTCSPTRKKFTRHARKHNWPLKFRATRRAQQVNRKVLFIMFSFKIFIKGVHRVRVPILGSFPVVGTFL